MLLSVFCISARQFAVHNLGLYATAEAEERLEAERLAKMHSQLAGGLQLVPLASNVNVPWNESLPSYNDERDEVQLLRAHSVASS
jgi:hypothetical protein